MKLNCPSMRAQPEGKASFITPVAAMVSWLLLVLLTGCAKLISYRALCREKAKCKPLQWKT